MCCDLFYRATTGQSRQWISWGIWDLVWSSPRQSRLQVCGKEPRLCGPTALSPVTRTKNSQDLGSSTNASESWVGCPKVSSSVLWEVDWIVGLCANFPSVPAWQPERPWFLRFVEQNDLSSPLLIHSSTWGQALSCPFPGKEERLPTDDCTAVSNVCMWSGMSRLQDNASPK